MSNDHALAHQFSSIEQQDECYNVGMWAFLVTEIMFFGGLFGAYAIYRLAYPDAFTASSAHLDAKMGCVNTFILLTSSLTMALAVRGAQLRDRKKQLFWLTLTVLFAFGFLVVKYFEYGAKIEHHLVPGPGFVFDEAGAVRGQAQMFFSLYFAMTGLHGIHVIIGIIMMFIFMGMLAKKHPTVMKDHMPMEMGGLYWHFVDIVWIFLYPLLYLIHPHW